MEEICSVNSSCELTTVTIELPNELHKHAYMTWLTADIQNFTWKEKDMPIYDQTKTLVKEMP